MKQAKKPRRRTAKHTTRDDDKLTPGRLRRWIRKAAKTRRFATELLNWDWQICGPHTFRLAGAGKERDDRLLWRPGCREHQSPLVPFKMCQ
jgi:hypothetical protein